MREKKKPMGGEGNLSLKGEGLKGGNTGEIGGIVASKQTNKATSKKGHPPNKTGQGEITNRLWGAHQGVLQYK